MMASEPATNRNELIKIYARLCRDKLFETSKLYEYAGYVTAPAREKQEEE
jgi:hypothetical protein